MAETKKKVNINIDQNKDSFYANNLAVFNNPTEFVLDFAQVIPKVDMIQNEQMISYNIKHNSIILEPKQAKIFLNLLKENIDKYEHKFGKIKLLKGEKEKKKGMSKGFSDYID